MLSKCDLAVNATPLGTKGGDPIPFCPEQIKKGAVIYDLVYCRETELLKRAKENGIKGVNGIGMLTTQAAIAFNIWTSKPLDETKKVMREAAQGLFS